MIKLYIEKLLIEIGEKIVDQKSSQLRADSALKLLHMERAKFKDLDVLLVVAIGLKEMSAVMKKILKKSEINIAILILEHFLRTNSFSLTAEKEEKFNKRTVDHFDTLSRRLEKIVAIGL